MIAVVAVDEDNVVVLLVTVEGASGVILVVVDTWLVVPDGVVVVEVLLAVLDVDENVVPVVETVVVAMLVVGADVVTVRELVVEVLVLVLVVVPVVLVVAAVLVVVAAVVVVDIRMAGDEEVVDASAEEDADVVVVVTAGWLVTVPEVELVVVLITMLEPGVVTPPARLVSVTEGIIVAACEFAADTAETVAT